jgi:hypothetical protein
MNLRKKYTERVKSADARAGSATGDFSRSPEMANGYRNQTPLLSMTSAAVLAQLSPSPDSRAQQR